MSWSDALDHTIKKWSGLAPGYLKRHGLYLNGYWLYESDNSHGSFPFSTQNCALCLKTMNSEGVKDCRQCPLYKFLGNNQCDSGPMSPFKQLREGEYLPMLNILKQIKKEQKKLMTA